MCKAQNRRAETLKSLINRYIIRGTKIHSDMHPSYLFIFNNDTGYDYNNVNHKTNFVNPVSGAHTQNIENLWSQFKRWKRRYGYTSKQYLDLYKTSLLSETIAKKNLA